MNSLNKKRKLIIISGIIYLLSLFTANKYILCTTMYIFIGTVLFNLYCLLKDRGVTLSDIYEVCINKSDDYYDRKKYISSFIYRAVFPMIMMGLLLLMTSILVLFII